ncbi:hypothetical protein JZ751_007532, partial [Albula glossodonta]
MLIISGLLEISPVERGVVTLFGVRSRQFVAMNSRGKLYGSCVPKDVHRIEQNGKDKKRKQGFSGNDDGTLLAKNL